MNKNNDWYSIQLYLDVNERSMAWLSRRLGVHINTIRSWKRTGKVSQMGKLALCYITGQTYEQLFY